MKELQGKKVFIVDKSLLIRDTLGGEFEKNGVEVQSDESSSAALLKIIHWHPDLVICGVELGTISGFDLCLILKMMPDYAGIPLIIISSGNRDSVTCKMCDVGADFYVPKDKHVASNIFRICSELWSSEGQAGPVESLEGGQPGKVLVVDDSKVMRRIISNILSKVGVREVCEAADGKEGLEQLEKNNVGLVLTDWNMPRMNGLEFVKAIRKQSRFEKLPVVMVTTENGQKERDQASSAGATAHIRKPFSTEKIKDIVDRMLR